MKARIEIVAAAARETKRRLDNPLTDAEKAEKFMDEAERPRKIHWTEDEKSERANVEAESRSATTWVGGF